MYEGVGAALHVTCQKMHRLWYPSGSSGAQKGTAGVGVWLWPGS